MAFRTAVKKRSGSKSKYSGIYEYYKASDPDKKTIAYYVAVRNSNGTVRKIKTDAKNKDEALDYLNKERSRIRKEKTMLQIEQDKLTQSVRHGKLTLDDMAKLYYDNRTAKNNQKDKQRYKNHLSPIIGKTRVKDFRTHNALELQSKLLKKPLSPKTVDNIIDQLKSMFNEGMREKNQWCKNNPVADKDIKRLTDNIDNSRMRILNERELNNIFETSKATNYRLYLLMKLLYHTAARPEAIIELQVSDINFNQKRIHLKSMKKAKAYSVPITDEISELVKAWIKKHDLKHTHFIFYPIQTGDKTKPAIYENFRRAAKNLLDPMFNKGIPSTDRKSRVTLYTLRHTAATKVVAKLGIKVAKEFLNHSDLKVTEVYAKVVDQQMHDAAAIL